MINKSLIKISLMILFLGLGMVSCVSVTPHPTKTTTGEENDSPMATPTILFITETVTESIQKTRTQIVKTIDEITATPKSCPPFEYETELPDPDTPKNYIGYHLNTRELPQGLEYMGGGLVPNGYDLLFTKLGWHENRQLYLLEFPICHDEFGHVHSEIVDVIATPPLSGNETPPIACFDGETQIEFRVGLGVFDESNPIIEIGEYKGWQYTEVLFLYDIDHRTQKFIPIDIESMENLICIQDLGPGPNF